MVKINLQLILPGLAFCLVLLSCEAPRKNPLDPQNPHTPYVLLQGSVVTASAPNSPIDAAEVIWKNGGRRVETDAEGFYQISGLLPTNGWLICRKSGYQSDSLYVVWQENHLLVKDFELHKMPSINGRIQSSRVPPRALADVRVTWMPGNQFVFSDGGGYYTFSHPTPGNGTLTFEKEGFKLYSTELEWDGSESKTLDVFMNAKPKALSFSVYSIVENNYGPRQTQQMVVTATITDEENDIDSVYIENEPLNIRDYLQYDVLAKKFYRNFSIYDLQLNSLNQTVGHDFSLVVVDQAGDLFVLGEERIERVIQNEVEIVSPSNGEGVSDFFTMKWSPFLPGFPFSYTLEVYSDDDFTPELVWQKQGISSDSLSTTINTKLEPREYVWMIWCVDEFNNRSRSKPGSFEVIR
ncbi:MAG: carboxypeptidase regulatory-like domain-containing protein [Calditrichaeota bacterium]|nr:MAG: carboxypeptidase regulatory-like domain-containing protein [Calditrichota bacterium]